MAVRDLLVAVALAAVASPAGANTILNSEEVVISYADGNTCLVNVNDQRPGYMHAWTYAPDEMSVRGGFSSAVNTHESLSWNGSGVGTAAYVNVGTTDLDCQYTLETTVNLTLTVTADAAFNIRMMANVVSVQEIGAESQALAWAELTGPNGVVRSVSTSVTSESWGGSVDSDLAVIDLIAGDYHFAARVMQPINDISHFAGIRFSMGSECTENCPPPILPEPSTFAMLIAGALVIMGKPIRLVLKSRRTSRR